MACNAAPVNANVWERLLPHAGEGSELTFSTARDGKAFLGPLLDQRPEIDHELGNGEHMPWFASQTGTSMREIIRRNRSHPPGSLQQRLLVLASTARSKADTCSDAGERDALLRKAEQVERTAAMEEWIRTRGLPLPV
jgi:hypothetical protein